MYYRSLSSSSVRRLKPSTSSSSPSSSPSSPTSPSSPIGSSVEVVKDRHGVDQALIRNQKGYSVRVSLYGAQVLSWMTDRGEELLFTSSKATYKPPKAYRGGIPICFPQFGNRGALEQHGFARNSLWALETNPPPLPASETIAKTYIDFLLKPSDEDLKIWPHVFEFRLRVALGPDGHLHLISRIRNVDTKPFSFSFAFHTYLAVSDIGEVRIEGLETYDYLDNLRQRERFTDQGNSLTFESETDRIYVETSNLVAILDHERRRTYYIRKEGLPDFVVWNPWDKKSKAIPDFGDEDYKKTLCVDGSAIENPIVVKPNEEWTGKIELFLAYRS